MIKTFYIIISFLIIGIIVSCDDGDIIVDPGFEFSSGDLELCNTGSGQTGNIGNTVFYNINSTTNEAIAFELSNRFYELDKETTLGIETIAVETTNFSYRKFESTVTSDYFCSGIPDSKINILSELEGNRGSIEISTVNVAKLDGDNDNDGIENADEGFTADVDRPEGFDGFIPVGTNLTIFQDTDGDEIPDFLDADDDNDNVLTSQELDDDNNLIDTDGDGIFDHLDTDDDGDMVLTRNEVSEGAELPTGSANQNADELKHYLNDEISVEFVTDTLLINRHTRFFKTSVRAGFVGLTDGNTTISKDNLPFGEIEDSLAVTDTLDFNEINASLLEEEEEEEEEEEITEP